MEKYSVKAEEVQIFNGIGIYNVIEEKKAERIERQQDREKGKRKDITDLLRKNARKLFEK